MPICADEQPSRPLAPEGLITRPSGRVISALRRCAAASVLTESFWGILRSKSSPVGESATLVVGRASRFRFEFQRAAAGDRGRVADRVDDAAGAVLEGARFFPAVDVRVEGQRACVAGRGQGDQGLGRRFDRTGRRPGFPHALTAHGVVDRVGGIAPELGPEAEERLPVEREDVVGDRGDRVVAAFAHAAEDVRVDADPAGVEGERRRVARRRVDVEQRGSGNRGSRTRCCSARRPSRPRPPAGTSPAPSAPRRRVWRWPVG